MLPRVVIIILNWNGWADTIECLESLYKIEYSNYNLILVDNASNDDSIEKIKEYCSGKLAPKSSYFKYTDKNKPITVKEIDYNEINQFEYEEILINTSEYGNNLLFIKNDKNYGFTEGNNIAIRFAMKNMNPKYFLLLNNDTVVDNRFLDELIQVALKKDKIGFLGPKIYCYNSNNVSRIISFAGGNFSLNTCQPHPIGVDQLDNGQFDSERKVDYLEGSCLLVNKELINEIGRLDREYFTYWEEIDWCIRGQKAGYNSLYAPKSVIWHKGYGSNLGANSIYYMIKNRFLFIKKNTEPVQMFTSLLYYFGYYFWILLFSVTIIHRDRNKAGSFLKGTYDGIKRLKK